MTESTKKGTKKQKDKVLKEGNSTKQRYKRTDKQSDKQTEELRYHKTDKKITK